MSPTTWIIIIGYAVLIIALIVGVIVSSNNESANLEKRLGQYLEDDKKDIDKEAQRSVVTDWVSRRVAKTSFGDRVARDLARADLKFKVGECFVLILASVFIGALLAFFIGCRYLVSAVSGAVVGGVAAGLFVREKQ